MFPVTKSRDLDEVQSQDADLKKRHYGEDVKFYPFKTHLSIESPLRQYPTLSRFELQVLLTD